MTTYCSTAIKLSSESDSIGLISQFAIEHYNARQAVQIDQYQFVVDNGMNDLRAVLKEELGLIALCCRYEKDVEKTEAKIQAFCQKYKLESVHYAVK
ncbi:hypothetical protein [Marinomonas sp. IMCC 4694]|uniref:hypothetical protein n=1 Tax=Marinomonas sp. IMCC 4694 TaxID=2605432 RepID=UPI0011E68F8E|nr:hypothetical protein [Marinomonas sp. IMCC 4694]TYL46998.1 hypothetical protein FXV75_03035 [Marinomonas sp. IMCC 4694]